MPKHNGWNEGKQYEKDDEADKHANDVLAKWPGASVFVVTEAAGSEEALVECSTQVPTDRGECH